MAELFFDCDNGRAFVGKLAMLFITNDKRILEATRTINHRTAAKAPRLP